MYAITFVVTPELINQLSTDSYYYLMLQETSNNGIKSNQGVAQCVQAFNEKIEATDIDFKIRYCCSDFIKDPIYTIRFELLESNRVVEISDNIVISFDYIQQNELVYEYQFHKRFSDTIELFDVKVNIQTISGRTHEYRENNVFQITYAQAQEPDNNLELLVNLSSENGYVSISTVNNNDSGMVYRKSSSGSGMFEPIGELLSNKNNILYDMAIEQGESYQYLLFNETSGQFGNISVISNVDYEYVYISDGEYSLKLPFNTQVTNFKATVQEQKIMSIDSAYPRFFKNGKINYKEFSVSSLLSYQSDTADLFYSFYSDILNTNGDEQRSALSPQRSDEEQETLSTSRRTTTGRIRERDFYYHERQFKLKVLNWINNGKPKLFKSPTEGNYIVRASNASLAPETKLGRALHTINFSITEIDKYNEEALLKYQLMVINKGAEV